MALTNARLDPPQVQVQPLPPRQAEGKQYMTSIACLGDATTHGGRIITGSDTMDILGHRVAREGDFVTCPAHGTNVIIQGSEMLVDSNGKRVALHGHLTACGSQLLAFSEHGSID
jgi:uncharacterized Zn-binding protein involved in type VI secretion